MARGWALCVSAATAAAAQTCPSSFTVLNDTSCPPPNPYSSVTTKGGVTECCSTCAADAKCLSFVFNPKTNACKLQGQCPKDGLKTGTGKVTGMRAGPPTPAPPPPPPPPAPVPAGSQKNVVVLLTDDQDLRLGSMVAMPFTQKVLGDQGANMSNFFVNTPICCPSRTTLLSGRWNHNNKVSGPTAGGCMRMNTSRDDNPQWWEDSFVYRLHVTHGYATGMFGKVLNNMKSYGCDSGAKSPGVDRMYVMCNPSFFNEKWADQDWPDSPQNGINNTGTKPEEYTTSLVGNASLAWIRSIVELGPDHPPFFAWLGPHAPHLPSTPAPWYEDHPIGNVPVPTDGPDYNYLAKDMHAFLPDEPEIDAGDAKAIADEHAKRLRSLLSVDDITRALHAYLTSVGEWDRTYFLFTSDHGYNLGQFRVDSHKTMVYDHTTRVPMLIHGPGIAPGTVLAPPTSMADLAPTILELVAGSSAVPASMDGASFAAQLTGGDAAFPRTATLIEYQSIRGKNTLTCEEPGYLGSGDSKHFHDGPNNTFAAMRIIGGSGQWGGDMLYAEFTNVNDPKAWDFAPDTINFYELYNVSEDYYMLNNIYKTAPKELTDTLHDQLHKAIACKGSAQCNGLLNV